MSRYTRCISSDKASRDVWSDVSVSMILSDKMVVGHDSTSGGRNSTASTKSCIQAAEYKLKKYNVNGICDNLQVGPYVSCSEGSLPDFPPKPELDGSLKTYTIKKDDDCQSIANRNSVTVDDINNRNKNTWGWSGYKYLLPDAKIYLSTESPPMRAEVDNAICGPQASGTEKPEIVVRVYGYFSRNGRAAS